MYSLHKLQDLMLMMSRSLGPCSRPQTRQPSVKRRARIRKSHARQQHSGGSRCLGAACWAFPKLHGTRLYDPPFLGTSWIRKYDLQGAEIPAESSEWSPRVFCHLWRLLTSTGIIHGGKTAMLSILPNKGHKPLIRCTLGGLGLSYTWIHCTFPGGLCHVRLWVQGGVHS